ncbi:hypothetical protein QRO08_09985 [Paracidovorax citrulli]|uniref:TspB protein n=2 Tax=Paracidovorax citrulli TaxID=80869 RepID=A1TPU1_PARC0|nr:hypothetical protein [Paracidovorax citrulli]ABM32979.1 hypothetical protein Aave_2404 [Paracidovorax citrulli AAC00-1]PVY67202.1 hypothetical protein C8E08_4637 [Paracidovorax citrulli]REG68638.1 hypothetical protein C8E07_1755 [Paracidovorax citrulli]RLJ93193.1 hypothetical protein C8E06_1755 [Paracidovorax citrulli]UMT82947.1 hypothetical protein FRC75_05890 [Paracidovorax citrulli]
MRKLLIFSLLAASSSAFASSSGSPGGAAAWDAFMGRVVGNQTTVTFGTGGQPLVTSSAGLGNPAIGNMAVSRSAAGLSVAGNVRVPLGDTGRAVGAVARAPIARAAFLRGLGAVASSYPAAMALAVAAPAIIDWLGAGGVSINPNEADYPGRPFLVPKEREADGWDYRLSNSNSPWFPTKSKACQWWADESNKNPGNPRVTSSIGGSYCVNTSSYGSDYKQWERRASSSTTVEMMPASLDDIAPYMDAPDAPWPTPQAVEQAVTKAGIDPFGAQEPEVKVSGPDTVPGAKSQTSTQVRVHPGTTTEVAPGTTTETQPATKTVTSQTNHKVTYNNNVVNYTTNVNNTTTITNNVTGQTDTTTDSTDHEDDAKPEEPATDTPLGPLPKLYERKYPEGMTGIWAKKKDQLKQTSLVTFVNQIMPTGFVSGSCPSWQLDLSMAQWADMGVHEVAPPCWIWPAAKAILIVSALILARALIFGG